MTEIRQYDQEYKVQAVKLAKEIGIPKNTLNGWMRTRMKTELLYDRYQTGNMTTDEIKSSN